MKNLYAQALERLIFCQERIGLGKKPFQVLKFRTMRGNDAPTISPQMARTMLGGRPAEPERITKIGCILRVSGADELPQVTNIIRGEMQLLGLRPQQEKVFAQLPPDVQEYYQESKPGLIGGDYAFGPFDGTIETHVRAMRSFIQTQKDILRYKAEGRPELATILTLQTAFFACLNHALGGLMPDDYSSI